MPVHEVGREVDSLVLNQSVLSVLSVPNVPNVPNDPSVLNILSRFRFFH